MHLLDLPTEVLTYMLSYNNFPYCICACKELNMIEEGLKTSRFGFLYDSIECILFCICYDSNNELPCRLLYYMLDSMSPYHRKILSLSIRYNHYQHNEIVAMTSSIVKRDDIEMMEFLLVDRDIDIICKYAIEYHSSLKMLSLITSKGIKNKRRIMDIAYCYNNRVAIDHLISIRTHRSSCCDIF
jgi:hypothetical protein